MRCSLADMSYGARAIKKGKFHQMLCMYDAINNNHTANQYITRLDDVAEFVLDDGDYISITCLCYK